MKLLNTEGKTFLLMIISNNGRPKTEKLIEVFGTEKGNEMSRQLNLANFAKYTDAELVKFAQKALQALA